MTKPTKPRCLHCRKRCQNKGRRKLCSICFFTPGVRDLYPLSDHPSARRGSGTGLMVGRPTRPTSARPGTPEKLAVLRARAAAGEVLFHPLDGRV